MTPHTSDATGAEMDGESAPGDIGTAALSQMGGMVSPLGGPLLKRADDVSRAREAEFSLFYTEQLGKLVGFLTIQGASIELAADVAQDAMILTFRNWDDIDSPRAWVRAVASRLWWKAREGRDRESPYDEVPEPRMSALLSIETAEAAEAHYDFLTLIRALPARQRQVLAWSYDGFSPQEIGEQLRMKSATVRSTLRNARAALLAHRPTRGETR